jgi:L-2-amino-thiazoline-4-carboxylic acid hydrolase
MDDLQMEKDEGFSWEYLGEVPQKKEEAGDKYLTPGFGLAGQLFASVAKVLLDRLGPEEGEALLKEAVDYFGMERGRRIARRVKEQGLPLTFKNWLIHTDIGSENFGNIPDLDNSDLVVKVGDCTFFKAAEEWRLGEYAKIYCKYADYAILRGYNPDIKLVLDTRHSSGEEHCCFRYIMKEANM